MRSTFGCDRHAPARRARSCRAIAARSASGSGVPRTPRPRTRQAARRWPGPRCEGVCAWKTWEASARPAVDGLRFHLVNGRMSSVNATRAEFLAAKEATGEDVSLLRVLRGDFEDPLARWTRIRERHGDVSRYRFGFDDSHFVTHPEGARRVLQDNVTNYTKEHPSYSLLRRLVGNGLLTSEGSFWLRQRRLAQPAFHRQRIAAMAARMTQAAVDLAREWEPRVHSGEPFSMLEEMSGLTLRIVADALFGTVLPARASSVRGAWDVLSRQMAERFSRRRLLPAILPTAYDRAFRRARRELFAIVEEIVAEKRARGSDSSDLLSLLMDAAASAGVHPLPPREGGRRHLRPPHSWGRRRGDDADGLSSPPCVLGPPGCVPSREMAGRGRREPPAAFRVHAVQRRSSPMHREQLRHDGSGPDPRHAGAAVCSAACGRLLPATGIRSDAAPVAGPADAAVALGQPQ
ncbi:MAG: cytochrome P450 [Deltaproteobacteria bacterium]|nr:MAG: cytochrome P450 [Deltaproteobacteria bacterium]